MAIIDRLYSALESFDHYLPGQSRSTLTISQEPEELYYYVSTSDVSEYAKLIEQQNPWNESSSESLLREALENIQRLTPIGIDESTQRLLDAAIEHRETGPCSDVEAWALRLATDVKDAGD